MSDQPIQELPAVEPELFERARTAVQAIRGRGRRADGTFGPRNTGALKTGEHSQQLIEQPDVAAWHREQVEAITADLGGEAELTALQRGMVREVARVEVIVASLGEQLLTGGTLTPKGKMRAASTLYLQVLDRYGRLAQQLGLARRTKRVPTVAEFVQAASQRRGDAS